MVYAHRQNETTPAPAEADQIAELIELVKPIAELAKLALAERAGMKPMIYEKIDAFEAGEE